MHTGVYDVLLVTRQSNKQRRLDRKNAFIKIARLEFHGGINASEKNIGKRFGCFAENGFGSHDASDRIDKTEQGTAQKTV